MRYLDRNALDAIDAREFRATSPYPFVNPAGLLTDEGYARLIETRPDVSKLVPSFGKTRSHGQSPHDRYVLEYERGLTGIAKPWHDFVAELHGDEYMAFIRRLFGGRTYRLNMHWHYTPSGCSVSPHCDAAHKAGSHIFCLNTDDDWDAEWGGQTLALDDSGRFATGSAPAFDDFDRVIASECIGNYSVLFKREKRSWHGVRPLACPEDRLRMVFIVVINDPLLYAGRRLLNKIRARG